MGLSNHLTREHPEKTPQESSVRSVFSAWINVSSCVRWKQKDIFYSEGLLAGQSATVLLSPGR